MTISINDLDFDCILLDKKSYENFLFYYVVYKILYGAKPVRKVDRYIRKYDETKYLALFNSD